MTTSLALYLPTSTSTSTKWSTTTYKFRYTNKYSSNDIHRGRLAMASGGHGQNFKYLPMLQG